MIARGPRPRVYLHIGAMKTGTTYLQRLLFANTEPLAAAGVLLPPDQTWASQARAVRDVLGVQPDALTKARAKGQWDRLIGEVFAHPEHTSVVSMEFLSFATPRSARRVMKSLKGADVHVILGVRDAARAIPAQWQTYVQNAGSVSWPDYAQEVLGIDSADRTPAIRAFRRALDVPRMLHSWQPVTKRGQLHVLTVPPSGSDPTLLWQRFASILDLDPASCLPPGEDKNVSLGHPSTELLRLINARLGDDLPLSDYTRTLKQRLSKQVLSSRAHLEPKAQMDAELYAFAADWNRRVREAVTASRASVSGDLDDLPVDPAQLPGKPGTVRNPAPDDVLAAAADALEGIRLLIGARERKLRAAGIDPGPATSTAEDGSPVPERWAGPDPVTSAIDELTPLVRRAIELERQLRPAV